MTRAFNWQGIRALYESGTTAYQLAKIPGNPSKQAIAKRARKEGWTVGNRPSYPVAEVSEAGATVATLKGDSSKGRVLAELADGQTYKIAAAVAGISDRTLREWREHDSAFAAACLTAKRQHKAGLVKCIDKAAERGDWKAAAWRLERDEDTREDFAAPRANGFPAGVEIVLHVNREEVTVSDDGRTATVQRPAIEGTATHTATADTPRIAPCHDPLGRTR